MTTFLKTARPTTAAIAWAVKDAIFVEIPSKSGPPYIARYKKTVEGLTAALNILIEHADNQARSVAAPHPSVKRPGPKVIADEKAREAAANIVKKMFK